MRTLPTEVQKALISNETITFEQCISLCVFIAFILFILYFVTWYIGSKQ